VVGATGGDAGEEPSELDGPLIDCCGVELEGVGSTCDSVMGEVGAGEIVGIVAAIDDEPAGIVIQEDIGAGGSCNTLLEAKAEKGNCVSSKMTL
jgi:hypothetical protein